MSVKWTIVNTKANRSSGSQVISLFEINDTATSNHLRLTNVAVLELTETPQCPVVRSLKLVNHHVHLRTVARTRLVAGAPFDRRLKLRRFRHLWGFLGFLVRLVDERKYDISVA